MALEPLISPDSAPLTMCFERAMCFEDLQACDEVEGLSLHQMKLQETASNLKTAGALAKQWCDEVPFWFESTRQILLQQAFHVHCTASLVFTRTGHSNIMISGSQLWYMCSTTRISYLCFRRCQTVNRRAHARPCLKSYDWNQFQIFITASFQPELIKIVVNQSLRHPLVHFSTEYYTIAKIIFYPRLNLKKSCCFLNLFL